MSQAIANFFLGMAALFGAQPEVVTVDPYSQSTAHALQAVRPDLPPETRMKLASFLASEDGKAIMKRWQVWAALVAIKGCEQPTNTTHAAGIAAGWQESIRCFVSLSRVPSVEAQKPTSTGDGEAELLERLSP